MSSTPVPETSPAAPATESAPNAGGSSAEAPPQENGAAGGPSLETPLPEEQLFNLEIRTILGTSVKLQVSPADAVQDVKQHLLEAPELCYVTNYYFTLNGKRLNDFTEFGTLENPSDQWVLQMVEAPYEERESRAHVRRLHELLSPSLPHTTCVSPSLFGLYEDNTVAPHANGDSGSSGVDLHLDFDGAPLREFYPPLPEYPATLRSLSYSAWNPPSGNRRLRGDLFYLEVGTLEGKALHVTAWTNGYYVNGTRVEGGRTVFDPSPAEPLSSAHHAHSLAGCLSKASPQFKKGFSALLQLAAERQPFEVMPVPFPVIPWLASPAASGAQRPDTHRAEEFMAASAGASGIVGPSGELVYSATAGGLGGAAGTGAGPASEHLFGQHRDFNEEYQSCRELPRETIQDRLLRDRALFKVASDFVDTATRGAMLVVNRALLPLNPLDDARMHMFLFNNVFFSYAVDGRDLYKGIPGVGPEGGDRIAHKAANNELRGVLALNTVDADGVSTPLCTVIDYRGHRLIAQSVVPGIMQSEAASKVVYGSQDNGTAIATDEAFHEALGKAAAALHLREHKVRDTSGNVHSLWVPLDTKGIVGTDGRRYLLDLYRLSPRDLNYTEPRHLMHCLRSELVLTFCEVMQHKKAEGENKEGEQEEKQQESSEKTENATPAASTPPAAAPTAKPENGEEKGKEKAPSSVEGEGEKKENKEETEEEDPSKKISLNPDVGAYDDQLADEPEVLEHDRSTLKSISQFVRDGVVPALIEDWAYGNPPLDGTMLKASMHARGLNIRYLGLLANQAATHNLALVHEQCVREMVVRAAKHRFRAILRDTEDYNLAPATAHFLNCFLGNVTTPLISQETPTAASSSAAEEQATPSPPPSAASSGDKHPSKKKKKKGGKGAIPLSTSSALTANPPAVYRLTTPELWRDIVATVKESYDFSLGTLDSIRSICQNVPTLRAFCQKVGVQLTAREYPLSSRSETRPFAEKDVQWLFPVVKHSAPRTTDGNDLLEGARSLLTQGQFELAAEVLNEALAIYAQVYGPLHPDTAQCYVTLANVLFHLGDVASAVDHQKKAAVITERSMGVDHHDTVHAYAMLGLLCYQAGSPRQGLRYMHRAHYLSRLACGGQHPDYAATFTTVANMYQDLANFDLSLKYLRKALELTKRQFGEDHPTMATLYHQIAFAYSLKDAFKEALEFEKMNYSILHRLYGDSDLRVVESNIWLKQFTAKAVQAKMALVSEAPLRKGRGERAGAENVQRIGRIPQVSSARIGGESVPRSGTARAGSASMGTRPVAEIMRFINGGAPGAPISDSSASSAAPSASGKKRPTGGAGRGRKSGRPSGALRFNFAKK